MMRECDLKKNLCFLHLLYFPLFLAKQVINSIISSNWGLKNCTHLKCPLKGVLAVKTKLPALLT